MRVTMDFETRSAVPIRDTGAWMYAISPSTEPICLAYTLGDDDEPKVWVPSFFWGIIHTLVLAPAGVYKTGSDCPNDLRTAIESGAEVEAHNAFFERSIWNNIMVSRFGWPEIRRDQWRCSAAKASACALPRSLKDATAALGTAGKDTDGQAIMMRVCKPRKVVTAERTKLKARGWKERKDYGWEDPHSGSGQPIYFWRESPYDLFRTVTYCRQDVRAERALSQEIPDLRAEELKVWQVDQDINLRGIRIDRKMANAAIDISNRVIAAATDRARGVSEDAFNTLGQRDKVLRWLRDQGVQAPNLQAATVKDLLAGDLPDHARIVLECKKVCAKSSIKKYQKMIMTADPTDDRVRDFLRYHGASTGRWTGMHVQTQNFPRGKMGDPDTLCGVIRQNDLDLLKMLYDPVAPTTILSWALRGAICAPEGRDLVCADYSGVEARGLLWYVEDAEGLEIFERAKGQPGIYREMAGAIYNVDPVSIDKKSSEGAEQRQMGKQAILGLGYGMGAPKFRFTCAGYNMDVSEKFAKYVVETYRDRFAKVPLGWRVTENAAIQAVQNPGRVFRACKVAYCKKGRFLMCRLPSGRRLYYCDPVLEDDYTPWGAPTQKLTYMTTEGGKWGRAHTYGGKLVENIIQAICRDLEAAAIVRVELGDNPYDVIMHTHDELVAEVDEGMGSVEEFEDLISRLPKWAEGFPLSAEGWRGKRYRK